MTKSVPVGACIASTVGIAVVYASAFLPGGAPAFAVPLMVVSIATMMISVMILGAMRSGGVGRLALPFAAAWFILVIGFLLAHFLPSETALHPSLIFGLPRRAAIVMYGIGLLPLFAMPIAYALTFDDATLSEDDLARLRAEAAEIIARENAS